MKNPSMLKVFLVSGFCALALPVSAFAGSPDWGVCKKEMEKCKIDPKVKDKNEAIWACLEEQGETLSKPCEALHASLDKKYGKK